MTNLEETTDTEIALFFVNHIINPCTVKVEGVEINPRGIYIREARSLKSIVLRRSILGRLDRKVKSVANAWRRYEKIKK